MLWMAFWGEAMDALYDLRWMIALSLVLISADFWWGTSETKKRYKDTGRPEDRWRFSRAGRRTVNKLIDYLTYLLVGCVLGLAIGEPLGICNHVVSAAVGLGLGCAFDGSSIIGHVFAVHGVKFSVRKFLLGLLKRKQSDIGEAVEEALEDENVK